MKLIIDDNGNLRIGRYLAPPPHFVGPFDSTKHVIISEPIYYEEQGFWFFDAVWADTPDQPVITVIA